ncbi:bifunctional DNA primase/polymerase [Streptomyces sp. KL116D]|uniref:bifunctional DNA primase/polymerase n=1 Tax=Streptomyces sp. KL116D TaxID=3045152 RepID=UPI0035564393
MVRWLFDQAPKAVGYGIRCGTRLVGLDLDRKGVVDGVATLNNLSNRHGFAVPRTTTVTTPSGGFHLWLAVPGGTLVPNSVGRVGPGIDVRSSRGYLSSAPAPSAVQASTFCTPSSASSTPSRSPSSCSSSCCPRRHRPAPSVVTQPRPALRGGPSTGLLNVVLNSTEGNRNDRLYWAAAKAMGAREGRAYRRC